MAKKKIYNSAVVGCGYIGTKENLFAKVVRPGTHAGAYRRNKRTNLRALVDTDEKELKRAGREFSGVKLYTDVEKMLMSEKPDIVSVCVPTKLHKKIVVLCAKHRVPIILCEKPLADDIISGTEMVRVCKKNNSKLFVHYQRRFDSLIGEWKSKIDTGYLGEIFQIRSVYYNGFRNNATHLIDLLLMYFGKPIWVSANFNKKTTLPEKGMNIDGLMGFKKGIVASFQTLSGFYGVFELEIFGEKGMIKLKDNIGLEIEIQDKIKNKNFKGYFKLSEKPKIHGKPRSMIAETVSHLVSFLDGEVKAQSTGSDALLVLSVMDAIEKSAKAHGKKIVIGK